MNPGARILLIEDDPGIADTVRRVLADEGHEVVVRRRGDDGLACAVETPPNVVITDLRLPGLSGLELVRRLHAAQPRLPVILMTAFGTADTAIEATKHGAFDYLLKPFAMPQLLELVRRAAAGNRLMSGPVALGEDGVTRDALVGRSAAMQAVYKEIGRVASRPVTVLIRGETGTGKELVARALYQHSDRAQAPFIAVNCAAVPETLLESELFGHERGAFTGAETRRIGRFEQADHGTLFLDEIGDMTPATQVKLVRVLQERCLQRVGGRESIAVDVRLIAATHRDLEAALRDQSFREDLFYRLNVVVIHLPPLRNRREDIPDLVRYFLQKHGPLLGHARPAITPEAVAWLQEQPWPGNVRHLENVVHQVLLLAQGYPIGVEHARQALRPPAPVPWSSQQPFGDFVDGLLTAAGRGELDDAHTRVLEAAERDLFTRAIRQAGGNQAKAARWLGISRVTMKAKLVQFGLHPDQEPKQG
ncbi:MAG TPA: sigma-54 dependent transcriptional regulator [Opitutaceae bacterium]|nr:sigma-54 dependent transcriptional regulator [Opitutaceae bacterium]